MKYLYNICRNSYKKSIKNITAIILEIKMMRRYYGDKK